jgi:hypothetical protein
VDRTNERWSQILQCKKSHETYVVAISISVDHSIAESLWFEWLRSRLREQKEAVVKNQLVTWFESPGKTSTCKIAAAQPSSAGPRRIVLVDLYWTRDKDPRVPLGHASLLAALRSDPLIDARSVILPVNARISVQTIAEEILLQTEGLPFDQIDVGIGAYIWNEPVLQALLPKLRKSGFRGRIILGGPQVSYVERGLEELYPDADVFIRGTAEMALLSTVQRGGRGGDIQGVHFAGTTDLCRQSESSLETLPSPLLNGLISVDGQDFLRWETQRGCKFKCSFCQHRQPDARMSVGRFTQSRIMDEIDLICQVAMKEVAVLDPVFNGGDDGGHAVRVLQRFARNGYRGRLALQCRAEQITDEFLDVAQHLNVCLEFGLQTIHKHEQAAVRRINSMNKVHEVLQKVRDRGIDHEVSLIFGLPGQTLGSFKESVGWCLEREIPLIKAFPLLLLRGTELEVERARWHLMVEGSTMTQVVQSSTFSRADWEEMRSISQALLNTEGHHPPLRELIAMASTASSDRLRFEPDFVEVTQ